MHAIRKSKGMKTLAAALLAASIGLASTGHAQTALQFSSEADSISGTTTQTLLGLLPTTQTIKPADQSVTNTSGSNSQPASSVTEDINGVVLYQSDDDDNSTDVANNQANASASAGAGSALGGLISWDSISIQLSCNPDGNIPNQIDCATYETVNNLLINGAPALQAGSFNPETSIPISGNIPDTNCPLGTDSFSGNVVLDNSILNSGTEQGSDTEIAMQITGTATCKTADLVTLYTTTYNLQIGGPEVGYFDADIAAYVVNNQTDRADYQDDNADY